MTKGRRLFTELCILVVLAWMVMALDTNTFASVLSVILIVLPIANWAAAIVLFTEARRNQDVVSLVGRADDAISLAIASTGAAFLGALALARAFGILDAIPSRVLLGTLGFVLVLVSVPAIGWLTTWRDVWLPKR